MLGQVNVSKLTDAQMSHLEKHLSLFLKESQPELPSGCDVFERLIQRILFWLGSIQRQESIPISQKYWVNLEKQLSTDICVFNVAIPVRRSNATLAALEWLRCTVQDAFTEFSHIEPSPEQIQDSLDRIHDKLKIFAEAGINQHLILQAADRLDIPVTRLNRQIVVLGSGCFSHWVHSTVTDKTSVIGLNIANNKEHTASLLRTMGLPGPEQIRVASSEEAIMAAEKLGYPVVVKPADKDRGIGVNADLRNEKNVISAYHEARSASDYVLVEKFCSGFTHRLTVHEGEVIRVTRRIAGGITGNGENCISELVALWNESAESRRRSRRFGRTQLTLDTEAKELLSQQMMDEKTVPEDGQYIRLRRRDNINAGGTNEYLDLDEVNPDNIRLAVDTARLLGLDFAGIDLIIDDIKKSWRETPSLICEVNAKPQMGDSRNEHIYDRVLRRLMGADYRIPTRLLICPDSVSDKDRLACELSSGSEHFGVSCINGLWIYGKPATTEFDDGFLAARALLIRPEIKEAAIIMTPGEVFELGLPTNHFNEARLCFPNKLRQLEKTYMRRVRPILRGHISGKLLEANYVSKPTKIPKVTV